MTFKQYPELPLGLEYELCQNIALCITCGGVVDTGEQLVRLSKYRNRVFEDEFFIRQGKCLNCTKESLARIVAKYFEGATNMVTQYNTKSEEAAQTPDGQAKLQAMSDTIEHMQMFITLVSDFVSVTDKEQVTYVHQPEPDLVPESSDESSQNS